jgi:putative SOS response-associated peptidase YedK
MAEKTLIRAFDTSPVLIRSGKRPVTLEMHWGLEPVVRGGRSATLVRADGREFAAEERCLIPATSLFVKDDEERKWTVTFEDYGSFFCFPGIWRKASATWPDAYAVLTVPAYPDLAHIKDRHDAFLPRSEWMHWLCGFPTADVLKPLAKGSLRVEPVGHKGAVGDLFFEGEQHD